MSGGERDLWKGWEEGPPRTAEWLQRRKDEEFSERARSPVQLTLQVFKKIGSADEPIWRFGITENGDCVYNHKHIALGGDPSRLNSVQWTALAGILSASSICSESITQDEMSDDYWQQHQSEIEDLGIVFSTRFYSQNRPSIDHALAAISGSHVTQLAYKGERLKISLFAFQTHSAELAKRAREEGERPSSHEWKSIGTILLEEGNVKVSDGKHDQVIFHYNFESLDFARRLRVAGLISAGSAVSKLICEDFSLTPELFSQVLNGSPQQ